MLFVWHDCITYGLLIYATIGIVYGILELDSRLHDITIAYHVFSFRNSGISYGIVIYPFICIIYCITSHMIWHPLVYYTMLLWQTIGHPLWLMAHHVMILCTDLFIICTILCCIIHELSLQIIGYHLLVCCGISCGILVSAFIVILYCIIFHNMWEDYNTIYDITAISLAKMYYDIISYRLVLLYIFLVIVYSILLYVV